MGEYPFLRVVAEHGGGDLDQAPGVPGRRREEQLLLPLFL
jgi:hypothetical protein